MTDLKTMKICSSAEGLVRIEFDIEGRWLNVRFRGNTETIEILWHIAHHYIQIKFMSLV